MKYLTSQIRKKNVIYHTEACPYAKRIKYRNRRYLSIKEMDEKYTPCLFCHDEKRYLKLWLKFFDTKVFEELEIKQASYNVAYVRTKAGFWKIFLTSEKHFILYHRNIYENDKSFEELIYGDFHRQSDVNGKLSLEKILIYIKEHDNAKTIMNEDWRNLPTKTRKQKKYYKAAEKRDKRRQIRNVLSLFEQLESNNPDLKQDGFV